MFAVRNYSPYSYAPGVTRLDCCWGFVLEGSKEALISSGSVKASWFVEGGQRDAKGRTIRTKHLTDDEGRKIMTRTPKHGPCVVWIHYNAADLDAAYAHTQPGRAAARRPTLTLIQGGKAVTE